RSAPPNLPRGRGAPVEGAIPSLVSPAPDVSAAAASGAHRRPTCLVAGGDYAEAVAGITARVLQAGQNVAVVAPTVQEAEQLAATLEPVFGRRVLTVSSALPAREATGLWVTANGGEGVLTIGTPEIALWPLARPALWVVIEEGRRAMKSKQTPTLQVREVVRRRALLERSASILLGPVPTVDSLAKGAAVLETPSRVWPLVEMVDRREDPPGSGILASRTVQAIRAAAKQGGRVFAFVTRRGYAPAFRCVRCRELRRCSECGAGPDRAEVCKRCGAHLGPCVHCGGQRFEPLGAGIGRVVDELGRYLAPQRVGPVGSDRQIIVGSERDLPYVRRSALAVAIDADSLLMAPHYRAEEDAARLLARVVLTVVRGRGHRGIIQTSQPDHRVLAMLRSGHPMDLLQRLGQDRERDRLPPAAELLAVEIVGDVDLVAQDVAGLAANDVQVHGPETGGGRTRWFLQGQSLHPTRVRMRPMVQRWRDAGVKVRVDADPIDL
ncbi:MAG: hypothetical protein QNJ77_08475, partial [Acidimicrobiia bacterium]|nr:hypothetical protein [Acidimicrobiia bacterium]